MGGDPIRHPIIVDTDAFIAVANTGLWDRITEHLHITTTNVCKLELERHVRDKSEYAPKGSQEHWVHNGSKTALEALDDEGDAFSVVSCVPRPHGEDAGEESLFNEIDQHPGTYRYAILMDSRGREQLNRLYDGFESCGRAIAPTFLLYLLLDAGKCTEEEFCLACGDLLGGEGWTGYQAIKAAWEAIPIDCSAYLSDDLLPE